MTNRDRPGRDPRQDWASQVPWHYERRGPYEDYGWEPGESVLPEFRDPSVHAMPYDRQRGARPDGRRGPDRQDWPSGAGDAPGRTMMRNPYDYDRGVSPGRGERRDFDYDRDFDQDRMRSRGQGYDPSYGRDFNQVYGGQSYAGQGYGRDYDQDRTRPGGQGYSQDFGERGYDRGFNQGYGQSYGRGYDQASQDRTRARGQGYGGDSHDMPATRSSTEYWLIPGPFTGRGPKGYQRSDDRIREDVCDRLAQHGQVDAGEIDVQVSDAEVTLTGAVHSREAKRMAEDAADSVQGVREVHNQLRVNQDLFGRGGQQSQPGTVQAQGGMAGQLGGLQRAVGGESRADERR